MLEKIFSSKTRVKILTQFSLHPGEKFYVRELSRILNENINSIRRELLNLENIKLLISEEEGNLKYYSMNEKFPIYEEIRNIFLKTQGISKTLKKNLSKHENIDAVFIYGSFASGTANPSSDIDIFVIGDINEDKLLDEMNGLTMKFSREINPVLFTKKELATSIKEKKPFIENVLEEPKLFIINDESVLEGDWIFRDLENKNYIRKIKKSSINVENSIKLSKRDLKLARKVLKEDYDWSFNIAYNSILQCTRGLMFSKGYRPASGFSHVATIEFAKIYLIESDIIYLNNMRKARHKNTYEIAGLITKNQAINAICHAEEMIEKIIKIIEKES